MEDTNPFLRIVPTENEKFYGERERLFVEIVDGIKKSFDGKEVVLLNGEYGLGKSFFIKKLEEKLSKKGEFTIQSLDFTANLMSDLNSIEEQKKKRNLFIIIDKFDLFTFIKDELAERIINKILKLAKDGILFMLACTPSSLKRLYKNYPELKKRAQVFEVPRLNYNETKELILSRLNSIRKVMSDSLNPFTDSEVKKIWKEAEGNPKLILMLCSNIYEQKMKI